MNFKILGGILLWALFCFSLGWIFTQHPFETDPRPGDIWGKDTDDPFGISTSIEILAVKDRYAQYKIQTSVLSGEFSFIKSQYDLVERLEE